MKSLAKKSSAAVRVWTEDVVLPTYLPAVPDKNPMFLEKRVYQGSSGKVYPLPFTDRIAETPTPRKWKAVWIENEFLRAMVLPEIGGRVHALRDKTNGYDLVYRQDVIKPALVGLAGPWISGGIEFNWPQHHRPATFLPMDVEIEEHADGSKTIWCSDHDPMTRMKGMHGICLHPQRACLELKVRVYNRTPFVQTFLWWANVATRVHEGYQSFFPPDVSCVADHAKRAMSAYPLCQGRYYGVNYGERAQKGIPHNEVPVRFIPPHCPRKSEISNLKSQIPHYAPNDLSWYANIPVPTSYMCLGSKEDFFGGYDHFAQAGIVHVADHHIAPGKKQWTWGNHEFGHAWDRNLTDPEASGEYAPYIELMAGVFTDNQPDFSFLQPGETKTWSQYWYPIQKIGPAHHANLDAAVSLNCHADKRGPHVRLGVSVTRAFKSSRIELLAKNRVVFKRRRDLAPGKPFVTEISLPARTSETHLELRVIADQREIIAYRPKPRVQGDVPAPATEPPAPQDIASADELYLTGLHLEQYRHATRCPTIYWREALRRDPLDARCNNAMGLWHLRRGEFAQAETHFRKAIDRLTHRNPNPRDGEPFYNLGLCLRYQADAIDGGKGEPVRRLLDDAYAAFYKATWSQAWAGAAYHALAEIDCGREHWTTALHHLDRSLQFQSENLRARNLKVFTLRMLDREKAAETFLRDTTALDPLDAWQYINGHKGCGDLQTCLDVAHDIARAGFPVLAIAVLEAGKLQLMSTGATGGRAESLLDQNCGATPLTDYTIGWLWRKMGQRRKAVEYFKKAAALPPDYCFPARLEEIAVLETAMRANPTDARAPFYLGNLLYDRRRHEEAIAMWERSAKLDPTYSVVWRNLGIGYFNIRRQPAKARAAYDCAFQANSNDARLLYERDQLWKRENIPPAKRLHELEKHLGLVRQRDDLSVELCALYNQTGRHLKAMRLLHSRHFQPWEGGEGQALGQHVRAQLALGREALHHHDYPCAMSHFEGALTSPPNLGEARHLLANQSDVLYWLGVACWESGEKIRARNHWRAAATFKGDFQEMKVRAFSEMTYYSALSWERLGHKTRARNLLKDLLAHATKLRKSQARIDYFATSLPTMLLFDDDIQFRQETTALFLQAQALLGLGEKRRAKSLLKTVLKRDPNHALAADLIQELAE